MVQCPMERHGESMISTIGIPWIFHGQYHGVSMEFWNMAMLLLYLLWIIHGKPMMYFPWLIHGISFGVLNIAIEKTRVFHEKPLDFHGQYDGFSKYGHAFPWKTYGSDHGFPWNTSNYGFPVSLPCCLLWISMVFLWSFYGFVPVVFSFRALVVRRFWLFSI